MAEQKLSDGSVFRMETVLATQALILKARLLKIVGGAVDRLPMIIAGQGGKASPEAKAASDAAAIAALGDMVMRCDPVEVARILAEIISYGSIQPKGETGYQRADLDAHFTDRKQDIYPVVLFALREIFGDFFTGLPVNGILKRATTTAH